MEELIPSIYENIFIYKQHIIEVLTMDIYKIIGLNSSKQAKRIKRRFCDALGSDDTIEVDLEHSEIKLPSNIDPYIISLISSFEQISIINQELFENEVSEDETEHHHHAHEVGGGGTAQRNILVVFFLNIFFSVAEFIFGTIFNSQAILSDAVHDFGDAMSIGLAFLFEKISNRGASSEYSYGYRRFSLLGALVTSVVLIIGGILIIIQAIPEFLDPQPVNHQGVFWVAIGAIIINGFSVWLMSRGKSANEKLLNIHLFEDLFGWLAVLLMSIILNYTNWYILDPLLSIAIALWILYVTLPEFLRINKIFLQAVPDNINLKKLHDEIEAIDHVQVISHFHIWSTDGQQHMMTLTATTGSNSKEIQENIKQHIRHIVLKYDISHITIEILYDPDHLIKDSMMCEG